MNATDQARSPAAELARQLEEAARTTGRSRDARAGRCAFPVAVDPWGAVSERCPRLPGHDGEHDLESDTARRERLTQAAASHPGLVLGAVDVVVAWLADHGLATGPTWPDGVRPSRELWTLIDVAEAAAAEQMASLGRAVPESDVAAVGVGTDG